MVPNSVKTVQAAKPSKTRTGTLMVMLPSMAGATVLAARSPVTRNRLSTQSHPGPPMGQVTSPDALAVLLRGHLSRPAAGHLQATLDRAERGLPALDRLGQRHPQWPIAPGQNSRADLALGHLGAHQPREDTINTLLHRPTPASGLGRTYRCCGQEAKCCGYRDRGGDADGGAAG